MMARLALALLMAILCRVVYTATSDVEEEVENQIRHFLDEDGEVVEIRRNPEYSEENGIFRTRRTCKCKCRSRYHRDDWHCCQCTFSQRVCFPGGATVRRADGTKLKMADLRRGERVLTVDDHGNLTTSVVRAFMQKQTNNVGIYLEIATSSGQRLMLSKSHLIYTGKTNATGFMEPKFADTLKVGDYVTVLAGSDVLSASIISIDVTAAKGAYTPLTDHGTILVDDVMASCYASFDHALAHVFMTPLRWYPWLLEPREEAEGMRGYVRLALTIGRWILPQGLQNEPPRLWSAASLLIGNPIYGFS